MSLKKLGRYDLVRVLGKGAMGLVYEGRDPNLDRRVAIKTIKVENLSDESAAEYEVRFRTEARSAARLQHPNIVSVYDSDRDGDIAFLVMEFIRGDDLKHHLDKGELYSLEQSQRIMADLLSALDYAHRQNIVHRDIKPANLLIEPDGRVKLADFGVARIQDSGEATRTQGTIVGTLKYMSPEQLQGRPIDARADLYAAGVVLYQLLTGKRPFDGDTDFAVIQQIVNHTPPAATFYNDRLPPAIDAVVARSLAKSRDERYATAQEFSNALLAACRDASDITIVPPASAPGKGSNATWTATMMPGESLVSTQGGATNSGTNTSASIVTQELELVYWKDIKESVDVEDIQGFLAKFPSGIYADLARRRLKKLGVSTGVSSGDESDVGTRAGTVTQLSGVPSPVPPEKTALQPRAAGSEALETAGNTDRTDLAWQALEAVAAQTPSLPLGQAAPAAASADLDATRVGTPPPAAVPAPPPSPAPAAAQAATPAAVAAPAKPKTALIAGAAVAVLAVAGLAFKLMSPSAPAAVDAAQPAASAAAAPASAASAVAATAPASAPQANASAAVSPALAASRAAAARKAAADKEKEKDKATKPAPGKTPTAGTPAPSSASPAATTPAPAAASAGSPEQACEGRMLLGFQTCMSEQCAKPAFASRPICIERRAIEQRREAERLSR